MTAQETIINKVGGITDFFFLLKSVSSCSDAGIVRQFPIQRSAPVSNDPSLGPIFGKAWLPVSTTIRFFSAK